MLLAHATPKRKRENGLILPRWRFLMLRFRPHPARPDGEEDGWLTEKTRQIHDPIRLVRMVKEIMGYRRARTNLIHHPGKPDGAFTRFLPSFLARHLVHHPHKADGVRKRATSKSASEDAKTAARWRFGLVCAQPALKPGGP